MTYQEVEDYLFSQLALFSRIGQDAYKPGLETTLRLSEFFGSPHTKFKAIHVAGTNGKGSTSHTLAAVLQSAGYKVGLYTSPHLVDFKERIRINGEKIQEREVIDFTERFLNSELSERLRPSFFELTTIMAFNHFARHNVDIAVIETGLGGRLDSTNILTNKLLSIVTNISLDHTNLLGHTEPEIAYEKAGIFAKGVPAIIGSASHPGVRAVFEAQGAEKEVKKLIFASEPTPYGIYSFEDDHIKYYNTPFGDISAELTGDCQPENTATVLTALGELRAGYPAIDNVSVNTGFSNVCSLTGLEGRWSVKKLPNGVRIIYDTGHNPGGWDFLGKRLEKISKEGNLLMVTGFVNDKDISGIMELMPRKARYYIVEPSIERRRPASQTASSAKQTGLTVERFFEGADSVKRGFNEALKKASEGDTIFIGGSTFVVADFLRFYSETVEH